MLGIRPWWKRPPWRWKDPMGTPRWKRGLGLPEMGVVRPHHDFPFWALYIKLLSLPVNAVFYSTRMMADIPRAVWKRFVSLQRGTVVKVVDWGLAKPNELGWTGLVRGVLLKKSIIRGEYEVLMPHGVVKKYNANDLAVREMDQFRSLSPEENIERMHNATLFYNYEKEIEYFDKDALISDEEDYEFWDKMNPMPTLVFGSRTNRKFIPGDVVRIHSGYRQGEYAVILKYIAHTNKWGVATQAGKELISYRENQLRHFDPTLPLESLIDPADPDRDQTLAEIESWRANKTSYMLEREAELLDLADDPNHARDYGIAASKTRGMYAKISENIHNPVLQHIQNLHALFRPVELGRAINRMMNNPVLSEVMDTMKERVGSAEGPRLDANLLGQTQFLRDPTKRDLEPEFNDIRDELVEQYQHEILPNHGIFNWTTRPKYGLNRTAVREIVDNVNSIFRQNDPMYEKNTYLQNFTIAMEKKLLQFLDDPNEPPLPEEARPAATPTTTGVSSRIQDMDGLGPGDEEGLDLPPDLEVPGENEDAYEYEEDQEPEGYQDSQEMDNTFG